MDTTTIEIAEYDKALEAIKTERRRRRKRLKHFNQIIRELECSENVAA